MTQPQRRDGLRRRSLLHGFLLAAGGTVAPFLFFPRAAGAAEAPASHPSLFFGPADLDALRARAAGALKPQLDALLADAALHLADVPPAALTGDYEAKGDQVQSPFLERVVDFSLLWVVTTDPKHLDAARRWALALAALPDLGGAIDATAMTCANCGYPEGWALTALAVAYDWLFAQWSPDEQALLQNKIRLLAKVLDDATRSGAWWTGAYLHHDTWIPLGGLGLGALSIVDEVPDAGAWVDRAQHELGTALSWLDDDGAWPEGPCGWAFALASVTPFWEAYRRRFPDRGAALLGNAWLSNTWKYRVASRLPDGRFLAFGDCSESGGYQTTGYEGAPALRWLAARYQLPVAQWQAAREWEMRPNPYTAPWEILFADPAVPEEAPDALPLGTLFANQATAYLRTGWGASDTVLAFRASGLLGQKAAALFTPDLANDLNNSVTHTHADGNSFGVWSRGDFAVTTAHYGQRATELQNTLLVDGQGQYASYGADHAGRPTGKVTAFFTSAAASFVAGDAAACYPPGLTRFVRRLFLVDPGLVFLHDDVAAAAPVSLQWRVHVDLATTLQLATAGFAATLGDALTMLRIAGPSGVTVDQLTDVANRAVTLTLADKTARTQLTAVLLPSLPAGATPSIDAPTPRSFVVDALDTKVLAAFADAPGAVEVPGRLTSDGSAAISWTRADRTGFLAVEATRLTVDGVALLVASGPVTVSCRLAAGMGELTVSAGAAVTVTVTKADGAQVTVSAPVGTSTHAV